MEAGSAEGKPGAKNGGEGGRGRKYRMGRWGIRDFETRVGRESSISRGGARLHSGSIHVGGVQVIRQGGSSKSSEFGEGKL